MQEIIGHIDKAFLLSIGSLVVSSILLYLGKLDSGSYVAITMGTTGAYILAWSGRLIVGTPAQRADAKATVSAP